MDCKIKEIKYAKYIVNRNLEILDNNEIFTELTGYTREDIINKKLSQGDLIFDEDKEEYFNMVFKKLETDKEAYIEHRIKKKDGTSIFVFCLGTLNTELDVTEIRMIDISNSLTVINNSNKYNKKIKHLEEEVSTDGLTGLLVRKSFLRKIDKYISKSIPFSFIMLDVDNFKNINDSFGHGTGDYALKEISKSLRKIIDNNGYVCRFGGDEFALLINKTDKEELTNLFNKLNTYIDNIKIESNLSFKITISLGCLIVNDSNKYKDFDSIYKDCDELLYESKENGKNQFIIK